MPLGRETKHKGNSLPGEGRKEDVSAAMKVRSSRVTISTRSTPRRRRLMSRQIEINDWMGDSKLTRSDVVVAERKMAAAATLESRATMVELGARDDGREEQASLAYQNT